MYPIHVHMRCLYYLNIVPLHMVGNFHKLLPRVAFVCRVFSINKAVIIEKKIIWSLKFVMDTKSMVV